MASTHTDYGKFINHYRALDRADLLSKTPLILSEGDSWFSMPLYYNLVDWLEIQAPQAVFLRMENSGDTAVNMFSGGNLRSIGSRLKAFDFDVMLLSAGGNDFVDRYLRELFKNQALQTPEAAMARVLQSGRFAEVLKAYQRVLDTALKARPTLRVLTHSYDYPHLLGAAARLTVQNIGLAALLKHEIGDWIAKHIKHVLPEMEQQRHFVRLLIDGYFAQVLEPLKAQYGEALHVVDIRGVLATDADWNDEMHPTSEGFQQLADRMRPALRALLPQAKQSGV